MTNTVQQNPINRSHGGNPELELFDPDHTPWNKRAGEVHDSRCTLTVEHCARGGWASIRMEETTQAKSGGPLQSRTISLCIPIDMAKAVAEVLAGKAKPPAERNRR
jgi:hypothetical protein